jgi:cell division protein FtsL
MDGIYTGLAIAPVCIIVVLAVWVIYASFQKTRELRIENERLIAENEII